MILKDIYILNFKLEARKINKTLGKLNDDRNVIIDLNLNLISMDIKQGNKDVGSLERLKYYQGDFYSSYSVDIALKFDFLCDAHLKMCKGFYLLQIKNGVVYQTSQRKGTKDVGVVIDVQTVKKDKRVEKIEKLMERNYKSQVSGLVLSKFH